MNIPMKNKHRLLALIILTLFATSQVFAAVKNNEGVIIRSSWGANESYRYVESNEKDIRFTKEDADFYEKTINESKFAKVITKDANGKEYKWPLQYPQKVQRIIIHHTATTNDIKDPIKTIQGIYSYHAITRGWGDIGYNYIMDQDGNIYEGRAGGKGVVGGHAGVGNNGSIGIAVLGNFEEKEVPKKVITSLAKFISKKAKEFNIDPMGYSILKGVRLPNILGHRDVMATACPGDYMYEKLPLIRQLAAKDYDEKVKFKKDYAFDDKSDLYFVELNPGEEQEVTVKFENIGKQTWDSKTFIVVDDNPTFGNVISFPEVKGVELAKMQESSVKPGSTGTFKFKIKAGKKADTVEMKVAILANGKTKIGEYFTLPVTVNQSDFRYKLVGSKLPPASMGKGEVFSGWVKLKNTGNTTWKRTGDNSVILAADHERLRNSTFISPASPRIGMLEEKSVKPGETGTFVINLKAPEKAGLYKEYFTPLVDWTDWMADIGMNFETLVGADPYASEVTSKSTNGKWQKGKSYKIWFNIKNMGTETWTSENIKLIFVKEETLKISKARLVESALLPGKEGRVEFTVSVDKQHPLGRKIMTVTPSVNGNYVVKTPITFSYTTVIDDGRNKDDMAQIEKELAAEIKLKSAVVKGQGTEGDIRIKLTFSGNPEVTASGSYTVKSGDTTLGTAKKDEVAKVEKSKNGYKVTIGNNTYSKTDPIRFIPASGTILKVKNFTRTDNEFRGILESRIVDGDLVLIEELPLEYYLKGLAEEPNSASAEKIKTIIVAARTYAKYYMDKSEKFPGKPYNLEDDPATSQKYLGYTFEKRAPNVVKAVDDTKGQMVTYNGEIVKTPYFSKSDGTYTKRSKDVWAWDAAYLVPVSDSACKSTAFSGHGVGLSGCGAAAMADQGKTYIEILKYYYTGVEITDFY
jgi:hypothetical protein